MRGRKRRCVRGRAGRRQKDSKAKRCVWGQKSLARLVRKTLKYPHSCEAVMPSPNLASPMSWSLVKVRYLPK